VVPVPDALSLRRGHVTDGCIDNTIEILRLLLVVELLEKFRPVMASGPMDGVRKYDLRLLWEVQGAGRDQ
jgi:hypothetical protein